MITGVLDPSGLDLSFSLDGNRVFTAIEPNALAVGKAAVVSPGMIQAVVDDVAHAGLAALAKRIGVTRESRVRFLKPLYVNDTLRVDGYVLSESNGLYVLRTRMLNSKEQLGVEADVEVFALSGEQVRRMSPNGVIAEELQRYVS